MSDLRSSAASFLASRSGTSHPRPGDSEATRYSDQPVEFHHEFTLGASGEVYPAGRYVIESADDSYAGAGHTAHVRTSTMLIVPTTSGTRAIPINVRDLETAMKEDAERNERDTGGRHPRTSNAETSPAESVQSQLERYRIERVPAEVFLWGGYRYTNASDAIAAAKRDAKA